MSSLYFYDVVSNDRFLFVEDQAGQDTNRGVTVVVNWFEELKRLVP